MPISSAISTSERPVQIAAVESRPDTPGRASGSNVIIRSPSVWLLMRLAVSSAVMEMLMAFAVRLAHLAPVKARQQAVSDSRASTSGNTLP